MLVYRDETSIEASLQCVDNLVVLIVSINSIVSDIGSFLRMVVTIYQRIGIFFRLCCRTWKRWAGFPLGFCESYNCEVLCLNGGLQNWYHGSNRKPFLNNDSNFVLCPLICV